MMSASVTQVAQEFYNSWAQWIALSIGRPFGFAVLFAGFYWTSLGSGMIRMAFAFAVALPALSPALLDHQAMELALPFFVTLVKEFFIGGCLGFIASVPLAMAIAAGGIVDLYRGVGEGTPDPAGGQVTPFGMMLAVATLWLFANTGGFQMVAHIIYSSYQVWPVQSAWPVFKPGMDAFLEVFQALALGALVLAGPLLTALFATDLIHLASTKFGKSINVSNLAFSNKNIVFAVVAPLTVVVAMRAIRSNLEIIQAGVDIMQRAFN